MHYPEVELRGILLKLIKIYHCRGLKASSGINALFFFITVCFIFFIVCSHAEAGIKVNVSVTGIEGDIKKNVLAYLTIARQKDHPALTLSLLNKLHEKAPEEIRKSLEPFGYYNPVIQSSLVRDDSEWQAAYTIDTGESTVIKNLNLSITGEGADNTHLKKLAGTFPFKKGDILNHEVYEQAKRSLYDTSMQFGYLKAHLIESKVTVYPDKNSADIILLFDTGPQYYFGRVVFVQDTFDPEFLSAFIPFRRGDPYSLSRLLKLQNSLNNSDYFEHLEVSPLPEDTESREVPVEVKLSPRKRHKYTSGFGYGTDTGFRGSLGWENRRVNRRGHRFKSELRLSEIRSGITAEYSMPLKNPLTDNLVFTTGWFTEDTKTSESDKFLAGARYNHKRGKWKESLYTNFEQEEFDIANESGHSTLLIPGISWTRTNADNPIFARKGSRIFMDVRGAHEAFISDTSFLQVRTQVKYIRGLTSLSRLIMRGEAGSSFVDEFSELPPSVRFFAGGDNSIRGYAYNSLGPENEEGEVKGGKYLLAGSIELEHKITDKWSAAVFYDAGNALDDLSDALKKGSGFGIRWQSPVGPIRLDMAFPLDEADESWRIHFILGPDL